MARTPRAEAGAPPSADDRAPAGAWTAPEKSTPAMRQYLEMKARHPDALLFFQMGDFYEMFYEDARQAAKALELALTSRQSDADGPIPMCGVPIHAYAPYCARLLEAGYKVAICDQIGNPAEAKGVVRREVVRVLTPGTAVADPRFLDSKESQYLAGLLPGKEGWGLAWADITTGEFHALEIGGSRPESLLAGELERLRPREVLLPQGAAMPAPAQARLREMSARVEARSAQAFAPGTAGERLAGQFPEEPSMGEIARAHPAAAGAAAALLEFVRENQPGGLPHLRPVAFGRLADVMVLDAATQRNLDLVRSAADGGKKGTLFHLLDETLTGMGGRLLKKWVLAPLVSAAAVAHRADAVEEFVENASLRLGLRESLRSVQDLERILGRVGLQTANARDLCGLGASLAALPSLGARLEETRAAALRQLAEGWDPLEELAGELRRAIVDDPPAGIRDGGMFRDGVDPELDRLRLAGREGKSWLTAYEARERERTGLPVKVGFNRVFGFYLELTKRFSDQAPPEYTRKQTLVSAERYITPELKKIEEDVLGAEEKAKELEFLLFGRLRARVGADSKRLLAAADRVARLDALAALAEVAARRGYVRPAVDEGEAIEIAEGRHPVIEADAASPSFVPNDLEIGGERQVLILTGPNMSGKSTYLRQCALIVLMAQMGSFVPARSARIGRVDRVFTRVGAHDRLLDGQSTFMVEMVETAAILREATPRSFVVLDEVGRGTSTYDGVSIAWAVVEFLHNSERCRPRTLFATHYHELAELAKVLPRVRNLTVEVREWGEEVVFLRKVIEGSCDRSYGIHVGRLAGLPPEVIARARELLAGFEAAPEARGVPRRPPRAGKGAREQLSLFAGPPSPAEEALRELFPDRMTPREALDALYSLKSLLKSGRIEDPDGLG
ncbi:MAG: DNA mismatch repair protein MutS [Candidatus Tectomicrobia bacterium]|uniref:DNA mismatch repair protein MutS n=1 Tax=Tectimicrobiota bacterium TaxID=2528274 RepID=A0A932I0G0_UNCTE|nr:DNA mismatch repair protein MutS [Candidatus Tectomicrobia bacterium]